MKVDFKDGFAVDFSMAVPECFRDSLAKERFDAGDILYDDKRAYLPIWSDAIRHITYAVQVVGMSGKDITFAPLLREGAQLVRRRNVTMLMSEFIENVKVGFKY